MAGISRREFLKKAATDTAVAGLFAAGAAELRGNPLGLPIGSQTYPHRGMVRQDFPGLMKLLASIGVERIELCSPFGYDEFSGLTGAHEVRRIITDHGLKCESGHFGMKELRQTQDKSIAWAKDIGITQMITATLGAGNAPTMDTAKKAADEYNKIAERAAKAGIQQGLHNEGFETSMVEGKRTYDVLLGLLDPKLVKFQFQVSTISQGYDAAEYFMKYPGRFFSMHVQGWSSQTKKIMAVGQDTLDWKKIFTAAKTGGVKNYFVEMNLDLMRASVPFLRSVQV